MDHFNAITTDVVKSVFVYSPSPPPQKAINPPKTKPTKQNQQETHELMRKQNESECRVSLVALY